MLPPICWWCKYYRKQENLRRNNTCDAFPDGIPHDIWRNKVFHQNPYEDDGDIQFELQENYEELPESLRLTLEESPLSSGEILNWIIEKASLQKDNLENNENLKN